MKRIKIPLLVATPAMFIVAYIVTNVCIRGAQIGGEGISRESALMAQFNPDQLWSKFYPFGLLAGAGVGLIVFIVGYLISPKDKDQKSGMPTTKDSKRGEYIGDGSPY